MSKNPSARCPVFLDETAYGRLVSRPDHPGWNPTTHLAEIDFGHGDEAAYIKLILTPHWPALANEAIGWHLAHACEIEAPERAAIITGSTDFWNSVLGSLPPGTPAQADISAWCVSSCATAGHETWVTLDEDTAALALLKTSAGQQIAAFDTWLLHPDRHPKNLLRTGPGRWAVIDHELILNGTIGHWRAPPPNLCGTAYLLARLQSLRSNGRISRAQMEQTCSGMVMYAERHIHAIATALPYLSDTLARIEPPESAKSVLPSLVDRAWNFWMPATVNKLL